MYENNVLKELRLKLKSEKEAPNYHQEFFEFSNKFMNEYFIEVSKIEIFPVEIEFYLFQFLKHEDPYVHMNPLQKTVGSLYVHEKGENRGGIDLTFGDNEMYGGILIRSAIIRNVGNDELVIGPSIVRENIRKAFHCNSGTYQELQNLLCGLKNRNEIRISKRAKNEITVENIYLSGRIGIYNSKKISTIENISECPKDILNLYRKYGLSLYRFVRGDVLRANNKIDIKTHLDVLGVLVNNGKAEPVSDSQKKTVENVIETYKGGGSYQFFGNRDFSWNKYEEIKNNFKKTH